MIPFYGDVRGDAYRRLIDYCMERSAAFVLAKRHSLMLISEGQHVLDALKPYLIETRRMDEVENMADYLPRNAITYSKGTYYIYRSSKEASEILKEAAASLFAWQHPLLPEDLCFWDEQENDFLYNVAHEEMAGMNVEETEAVALAESCPGLFFHFAKMDREFNRLLDDAIYHQASKLKIEMYGITEIPDRISELRGLKELFIFEQEIRRLPLALFELTELEFLTVYTAELEEIPAEIGKLVNLRSLTILCGCYHDMKDGMRVLAKEEIMLNQLPPEISQLKKLEHLHISYTTITELPEEMVSLQNLRSLVFNNNWLVKEPAFLHRMPRLEQIDFGKNPFMERE